jgi:hypothetical protein
MISPLPAILINRSGPPLTRSISNSTAAIPSCSFGIRTAVSGGTKYAAKQLSCKQMIDTDEGTERPASDAARSAPTPMSNVDA